MYATLKLLNSYFWKTIYGPILAFVFPIVLLAILGNLMRLEYVYPGIIALAMLFLGIIALPLAIMELKGTSLFKYIGSSPVNPLKFNIVVIGFYAFIAICTGVLICVATMAIFPTKTFPDAGFKHGVLGGIFTLKGSFSFYIGCAIHLLLVITCGMVIATFAKTPQQALTIGLMVTLPSMFLSGMILSVDVIGESPVMNWISRFIPFRYSTGNLVVAATPVDQLGSALEFWLNKPFDSSIAVTSLHNGEPNNFIDQMVWPYKDVTDSAVRANIKTLYGLSDTQIDDIIKTLPASGKGYQAWSQTGWSEDIFYSATGTAILKNKFDPTLYNLLVPKWDLMSTATDNNIFDWLENWGVKKIPTIESFTEFISQYFKGSDGMGGKDPDRFLRIWGEIKKGNYEWLKIFLNQSNILYYQADRVLNVLLPLGLSAAGTWYTLKNFKWTSN